MLAACDSYSGDGQLVDNGLFAATDRYVLDLGRISLLETGTSTYQLSGLPSENFVVGVKITVAETDQPLLNEKPVNAIVSLEVIEGEATSVIATTETGLNNWTWSQRRGANEAFAYVPVEDRGSYFDAHRGRQYFLKFRIFEPDSSTLEYKATLVAKTGGWK